MNGSESIAGSWPASGAEAAPVERAAPRVAGGPPP